MNHMSVIEDSIMNEYFLLNLVEFAQPDCLQLVFSFALQAFAYLVDVG